MVFQTIIVLVSVLIMMKNVSRAFKCGINSATKVSFRNFPYTLPRALPFGSLGALKSDLSPLKPLSGLMNTIFNFMSTDSAYVPRKSSTADAIDFLADDELAGDGDHFDSPEEGSLRTKVRQHVNPLARKYQEPAPLSSDWMEASFADPKLPMVIDIGCAKGTWALKYATANKETRNVLGLEIRRPIVELALQRKDRWALSNVHFIASNANVDLDRVLTDIQSRNVSVEMVTIQFPDPYFKKKQHKRRVVNDDLVNTLAHKLSEGTVLFIQSDVLDVQAWMMQVINRSPFFDAGHGYDPEQLENNETPYTIQTEREIATKNKGLPVYRMLYRRNSIHFSGH